MSDRVNFLLAQWWLARIGTHRAEAQRLDRIRQQSAARRRIGEVVLSVIPGMGYIIARKDRVTAIRHIAVSMACLMLAVPLYRTRIADILLLTVLALSVVSVSVAVVGIPSPGPRQRLIGQRLLGVGLLTVSAYASLALVLPMLLVHWGTINNIEVYDATRTLQPGDMVVFGPAGRVHRGDVVTGRRSDANGGYAVPGIGPIVGMPGETITIMGPGSVYVNGRLTKLNWYTTVTEQTDAVASIVLPADRIWTIPYEAYRGVHGDPPATVAADGVMSLSEARRAIAVVGPPARRGLVPRQVVFGARK